MSAKIIIKQAKALNIPLSVNGDRLRVGVPVESVSGDLLKALKQHKPAIMALLTVDGGHIREDRSAIPAGSGNPADTVFTAFMQERN